ncbi:recombinase family protein [Mycobacterium paraffinicum]|uniref:Recombinase family protein n=1 Tax=Mycobacterium paraffinicum TaxID=53378 RepID=A0ABP8F1Y7_9MYCO|nr:recombinase family protein [Mycobacterium paraffinicum]MCV7311918.1 recombinase family protein [Mycobacterium paraffinicum]
MRTAIYTRISADQTGEGLGVARQLEDCANLAARLGWEVVIRYDDNDLSAFNGKRRPGFETMLADMAGGKFNSLICWHTDRLYRSMRDLERLIDIAERNRITIKTVQGGDLDLSTSAGRMMARILGSVARQESEHTAERRKRANAQKAASGKWQTANRPFGYTQRGVPLEPEATMFRTAVVDVLAGKSIKQVAREWNTTGVTGTRGNKFTAPNVRRLLVNPRYAALNVHNGKVVGPGQWEPLIDADTHRGLVAFLSDESRIICTSFEKKYMGSGVYRCGVCSGPLRHAVAGGRNAGQRKYECRESNSHVVISAQPVDDLVEALVLQLLGDSDIHRRIGTVNDIDTEALYTQRSALQARLDELAAMFAEGVIDGSQLRTGTAQLRTQLAGVDGVLSDLARTSPVAKLLEAKEKLQDAWAASAADIKGKIIDELMVVTVNKATRKGGPGLDPSRIHIEPRLAAVNARH